ncbi:MULTISPECIES: hypothetical protein [unclassified Kitasatospora]|uniref:hypothetical protein n=1 Tax=unclassified Kitasatospora TaxID=2633591 RepID=UPI003826F0DE
MHPDHQRASLLAWAHTATADRPAGGFDVREWAAGHGIPEHQAAGLRAALTAEGLLRPVSLVADIVRFTPVGRAQAAAVLEQRDNRPRRNNAVRSDVLDWLYGQPGQGYRQSGCADADPPAGFLDSEPAYCGDPVTAPEVCEAIGYLAARGLAVVHQDTGPFGPRARDTFLSPADSYVVRLTARGIDCAESEKTVSEFVRQEQTAPGTTTFNTYLTDAQGTIIGSQRDFTQNNTAGFDPAALIHFTGLIQQSLPVLGLSPEEQAEAAEQAGALSAEAARAHPDRGLLRRTADRLVELVMPAAGTALGQLVLEAGNQAVAAIGG